MVPDAAFVEKGVAEGLKQALVDAEARRKRRVRADSDPRTKQFKQVKRAVLIPMRAGLSWRITSPRTILTRSQWEALLFAAEVGMQARTADKYLVLDGTLRATAGTSLAKLKHSLVRWGCINNWDEK